MKGILFILLVCSSCYIYAQVGELFYAHNYNLNVGDTVYIGKDGVMREQATTNGKILSKVKPFDYVVIERELEQEVYESGVEINGIKSLYYWVSMLVDGVKVKGYVWGGLFALTQSKDSAGNHFLYGVKSMNKEDLLISGLIMRKDAKTGKVFIQEVCNQYKFASFYNSKVLGGMGLSNIQSIFRMENTGEACGIPSTYYYYGWNGEKFLELPVRSSVSEAGIFYYNEKMSFPSEHKLGKDLIIIESTLEEVIEVNFEGVNDVYLSDHNITKEVKVFRWNGSTFRELKKIEEEQ